MNNNEYVDSEVSAKDNTIMNNNECVDSEVSAKDNAINISNNEKELYFYHKDWNEYCILNYDKNILYKKNNTSEIAKFIINNLSIENSIILNWEKWDSEIFYLFDNEYYSNNYIQYVILLNNINGKLSFVKYILNNYNNKVYSKYYCYISEYILNEDYLIIDDKYQYKELKSFDNDFFKELYINCEIKTENIENNFSEYTLENTEKNRSFNVDSTLFSGIENTEKNRSFNVDSTLFSGIENIENTIIAYKNEYQEYVIYKNNIETKILINIFDKNLKTYDNAKKGIYNINNNVLNIYWENFVCEKYILYN